MRSGIEKNFRDGKPVSTSAVKLSNNNYMNSKNSLLNEMLDAYKSNSKLIRQPVLDAKAKAGSKKIDDAYAKLMKESKNQNAN